MRRSPLDDKTAEILGNNLITLLGLKVKKENGRVDTFWGDKTPMGLGYTVERVVGQHVEGTNLTV